MLTHFQLPPNSKKVNRERVMYNTGLTSPCLCSRDKVSFKSKLTIRKAIRLIFWILINNIDKLIFPSLFLDNVPREIT